MVGLEFIEPTQLYNILNQATIYPCVSDGTYLLLLDARQKAEYNESHALTSKKAPQNSDNAYLVPYEAELECKEHVVVYDGSTRDLDDDTEATRCAKVMWNNGSRNRVKILRGGYEEFSALYPYLRTQTILYMPRHLDNFETYPMEIIPGFLYLGNKRHGSEPHIYKDMKIKFAINCTLADEPDISPESADFMQVPVQDSEDDDIHQYFQKACMLSDRNKSKNHAVLVYSDLGISRSVAMVLAYLVHTYNYPLNDAFNHTRRCCPSVRPNRSFIKQLSKWEEETLHQAVTDISDPNL